MPGYLTWRNLVVATSGMVVAGLLLSGAAKAITNTAFNYPTPRNGFLSLPAAAFTPFTLENTYVNNGANISTYLFKPVQFTAPVNLPNGAKMKTLAAWYLSQPGDFVRFRLLRVKLTDNSQTIIIDKIAASTGGVHKGIALPITNAALQTVDNANYAYFMWFALTPGGSNNASFDSARMTYTYTTAGD